MISEKLGKKMILSDGAMGTMMQAMGLSAGEVPEAMNLSHPEIIREIHEAYFEAGSDFVSANTFGANEIKLENSGLTPEVVIKAAVDIAKSAAEKFQGNKYVALDIGPIGKMLAPVGELSFDEAVGIFKRQVAAGVSAGVDFIFFETFTDIQEMKAAILGAKECTDLPIFCSITFEKDGRTLMGTDAVTAVHILQDMGIHAIGANCSLGPDEMIPMIKAMTQHARIPVLVQPNAGLPRIENGKTVFDVDIETYVEAMMEMVRMGVSICGGCCGTNPDYIRALAKALEKERANFPVQTDSVYAGPTACSISKTVFFDGKTRIIGERINPTGKKRLKEAMNEKDYSYIEDEAISQVTAGADIIGINMGLPEIDEEELLLGSVRHVSNVVDVPLQLDCTDGNIIEAAVRACPGKPIINSVNGEQKRMDEIFPIVKKYGTAVVALALDETGIPETAEGRIAILEKIINEAKKYGIEKDRLICDCITLTVSAQQTACMATLHALTIAKEKLGVKTILGVNNISYGLPERKLLNGSFLAMSIQAGLDAAITDPTVRSYMEIIRSTHVLTGVDVSAAEYIEFIKGHGVQDKSAAPTTLKEHEDDLKTSLRHVILDGHPDRAAGVTRKLLKEMPPLEIVEKVVIPALNETGEAYEDGSIFLPQMMKSADTVQRSFEVLRGALAERGEIVSYGKVILATVKDDIHDIGKNIVKVIMENYGYEVIDLGKDVPPEEIVRCAKEENIKMVGLSALMTTTVVNMEKTIALLRSENLGCMVAVGGAVLTGDYAEKIGADFYCENAIDTVRAANQIFKGE